MSGVSVWLSCLLLGLVSPALSCGGGGELVACEQTIAQPCVCLRIAASTGDTTTIFRACTNFLDIDYGKFGVREIEPGTFRYFPHILSLNLSANSPPELSLNSQSFTGLDSLTSLDLSNDGLSSLPDCLFTPLPSLETLYLQNNNLSQLNTNAFRENMSNLSSLHLDSNRLTGLPADFLQQFPALTFISLSSNMWDCSSPGVAVLVNLVNSGLVLNGDQLRCANSTLVSSIIIHPEPMETASLTPSPTSSVTPTSSRATPTLQHITPSPTSSVTPTSSRATPTLQHITPSPTSSVTPTSSRATPTLQHTPSPTPLPLPQMCSRLENSGSEVGFFDWPEAEPGERVERACPSGPEGGVASRECGGMGEWGAEDVRECDAASQTTLELFAISQSDITADNIEGVASSLSSVLSSPSSPLSPDEVEVVLDVTEHLISFPMASITVLNYSLQAVDHLLTSSGDSVLEAGPAVTNRLRVLIDTALLSFLSANNTDLVLAFSGLALGGVYLRGTNHTHIVAVITTGDGGEGGLVIGEEGEGGDVEVVIDGEIEGPIQVTVYNDAGIFNTTSCGENEGLKGDNDLAPVISVSDESTTGSESVSITYHTVRGDSGDVVCVRWNTSLNCGNGGWQMAGCQLMVLANSDLTCVCTGKGTFGILEIPKSKVEPGSDGTPAVVEYVFYCSYVLAALLYLPVILAVLCNRSLRVLPLKQCVANIGASQALSLLATAASYYSHSPRQLCYSLAVLQHYTALVALVWLAAYPILATLKVFRRTWFERWWLLVPVAILCWVFPAVVVGAVAASRFDGFADSPNICWLEGDVFPNYFTFISGLVMVVTLGLTLLSLLILCCSDYDLELPVHLRLLSNQVSGFLFSVTLISLFLAADSLPHDGRYQLNTHQFLVLLAVLALLTSLYFLLANGCANGRIRSVLRCQEDPALKRKVAHYYQQQQDSNTLSSNTSSRTSDHRNHRRNGTRIADEMNLNYVNSYLGYDEVASSHVPLDFLGQVEGGGGGRGQKRVKEKRSGEFMGGPSGFRNVGFNIPHATSMT